MLTYARTSRRFVTINGLRRRILGLRDIGTGYFMVLCTPTNRGNDTPIWFQCRADYVRSGEAI